MGQSENFKKISKDQTSQRYFLHLSLISALFLLSGPLKAGIATALLKSDSLLASLARTLGRQAEEVKSLNDSQLKTILELLPQKQAGPWLDLFFQQNQQAFSFPLDDIPENQILSVINSVRDEFPIPYEAAFEKIREGLSLKLTADPAQKFILQRNSKLTAPQMLILRDERAMAVGKVLQIPEGPFSLDEETIKRFLIGHPFYPHSQQEIILLREQQKKAILNIKMAILEGKKDILVVAPTAFGKTELLSQTLTFRQKLSTVKKISIVTVEQVNLTNQLARDIKKRTKNFEVVNWNEFKTKGHPFFIEILKESLQRKNPTILAVTFDSLRSQIEKLRDSNPELLNSLWMSA